MSGAYYNEIDPFAAQWLRNLIAAGHIAPGDVDERSIEDVKPNEIRGYTQCHFFAGVGVWSAALRQAGWTDDRQVWTGSCPCQPFSAAGKSAGFIDERHLWPAWEYLIEELRPGTVFGEQVASKDGLGWLDLVSADMEGKGYAFAAVDLCAAGVGAPHIRQRLFFVADASHDRFQRGLSGWPNSQRQVQHRSAGRDCAVGRLVHTGRNDDTSEEETSCDWKSKSDGPANKYGGSGVSLCWLDNTNGESTNDEISTGRLLSDSSGVVGRPGPTNGFWGSADWIGCRDGYFRPVEPGTFPLVDGATSRVVRVRAYGNAINKEVAASFISAYRDCTEEI